jgi:ferric-dicitrate binding protein FerR (iron transport regulator)
MIGRTVLNSLRRHAHPLRQNSSPTAAPRRTRRKRWPLALAGVAGAVTLAACATFETVDYYWQAPRANGT